jgi:hypothetical protein
MRVSRFWIAATLLSLLVAFGWSAMPSSNARRAFPAQTASNQASYSSDLSARGADTPETRLEAARIYLLIQPIAPLVHQSMEEFAAQLPPEQQETFRQAMARIIDLQALDTLTRRMLAQHFTTAELQAMTRFYGSPEGRSITRKMPSYMADCMTQVANYMRAALQQLHPETSPSKASGQTQARASVPALNSVTSLPAQDDSDSEMDEQ